MLPNPGPKGDEAAPPCTAWPCWATVLGDSARVARLFCLLLIVAGVLGLKLIH